MTGMRILLAICANADANGAHFGNPRERLNVQRLAARGYVTIVRQCSSPAGNREIYAVLTALGEAKLERLRKAG